MKLPSVLDGYFGMNGRVLDKNFEYNGDKAQRIGEQTEIIRFEMESIKNYQQMEKRLTWYLHVMKYAPFSVWWNCTTETKR